MKNKITNIIKSFLLLLSMVMGFFHIYATVWFLVDLPRTYWAMAVVLALAGLTEYGFLMWLKES